MYWRQGLEIKCRHSVIACCRLAAARNSPQCRGDRVEADDDEAKRVLEYIVSSHRGRDDCLVEASDMLAAVEMGFRARDATRACRCPVIDVASE